MINHVGVVVGPGNEMNAPIVEASTTVKHHSIRRYYEDANTHVAIFRPKNVGIGDRLLIADKALQYVGRKYGYFKIVAHFLDFLLGGRYFFRRITRMEKYPICSWVVADAYAAVGLDFGVPVGMAQPDDIWDFCVTNPDKYETIHYLGPLGGWEA